MNSRPNLGAAGLDWVGITARARTPLRSPKLWCTIAVYELIYDTTLAVLSL